MAGAGIGYGFGRVPLEGFVGFKRELELGPWGDVEEPGATALAAAGGDLWSLPGPVLAKYRLTQAISALSSLGEGGSHEVKAADLAWDGAQRRLDLETQLALESDDHGKGEAAARVREALLQGRGRAQTLLAPDREVDFGRHQVELSKREDLKADLARLGLTKLLKEIGALTEALAKALGRGGQEPKRRQVASELQRDALAGCVSAFNTVLGTLDWLVEQSGTGKSRAKLEAFRRPFLELLARYAGTPAKFEAGEGEAPAPAEPTPTPTPTPSASAKPAPGTRGKTKAAPRAGKPQGAARATGQRAGAKPRKSGGTRGS